MGFDCYHADAPDPAGLDDPGYFRLSIHVGEAFFRAMDELGMIDGRAIPGDAINMTGELITPPQLLAALSAYDAQPAAERVVRAHLERLVIGAPQPQPAGMPLPPDLPSMSGVAMEARRIGAPATIHLLTDKWAAWVDYLRRAAEHGGLRVR